MWTEMTRCGEQWKKVSPWWNQEVKDAIRTKKVACKAWRHNKADSSLHSRYTEARKPAALTVKKSNCNLGRISDIKWIPITSKQTTSSGKPSGVLAVKKLTLLYPSMNKWCLTQQWGGHPWWIETVIQRSFKPSDYYTTKHRRYIWRGKYRYWSRSLPCSQNTEDLAAAGRDWIRPEMLYALIQGVLWLTRACR